MDVANLNKVDKEALRKILKEISASLTRIEGEREIIKDYISSASEKYEIDKKVLRKMAKVFHNMDWNDYMQGEDAFQIFYEEVVIRGN